MKGRGLLIGVLAAVLLAIIGYFGVRKLLGRWLTSPAVQGAIVNAVEEEARRVLPGAKLQLDDLELASLSEVRTPRAVLSDGQEPLVELRNITVDFQLLPLLRRRELVADYHAAVGEAGVALGSARLDMAASLQPTVRAFSMRLSGVPVQEITGVFDQRAIPVLKHLHGILQAEIDWLPELMEGLIRIEEASLLGLHDMVREVQLAPVRVVFRQQGGRLRLQEPVRFDTRLFKLTYEGEFLTEREPVGQELRVQARANPLLVSFYAGAMGCPKEKVNFGQIFGKSVTRDYQLTGTLARPKCRVVAANEGRH